MREIWCVVLTLQISGANQLHYAKHMHNACDEVYCGCRQHVQDQPFQSTQLGMFQRSVGNVLPSAGEKFLALCGSVLTGADSLLIYP